MFKLDTMELQTHILEELESVKELLNLEKIHFIPNKSGSEEGIYVFSDHQGYHFVYSEKGCETKHKVTDDLFEITFWTANSLISSLALELLKRNMFEVENQRKYLFEQNLILFEKIGSNYKKAAEVYIEENLKQNPL